jgi:selenocysteine lyase/cysteine desulfurase
MTDIRTIRDEFPTTKHWVHLDSARKAALPRIVEDTVRSFFRDVYENAGQNVFSMERVREARRSVARLVGVPARQLAFVKSTSEGINVFAQGLGLEPEDHVLINDKEHGANVYPWRHLSSDGVRVEVVRSREGKLSVEDFVERFQHRTRVVSVSWVNYSNGFRIDVTSLGRICRQQGVLLLVDAIQGVGILDTPITNLEADAVASGGHKGLLGLVGAGFLVVREPVLQTIEPRYVGRFSFASDDKWAQPLRLARDARRFEYGNPNFLALAVLSRTARFLMDIGLDAVETRVRALTTLLIDEGERRGLRLSTPKPWRERAGIVSFDVKDPHAVAERLREKKILVSVKDGRLLRASCHVYNSEEDIEKFLDALGRAT